MCHIVKLDQLACNTKVCHISLYKNNSKVLLKGAINKNKQKAIALFSSVARIKKIRYSNKNYPGRIPERGLNKCAYVCTPMLGTTQRPGEDPYWKQAGSYFVGKDSQCLSSLALNELIDGAVTTSSGRLFQSDTILCEKKYFLTFSREIPALSFSECPLV